MSYKSVLLVYLSFIGLSAVEPDPADFTIHFEYENVDTLPRLVDSAGSGGTKFVRHLRVVGELVDDHIFLVQIMTTSRLSW